MNEKNCYFIRHGYATHNKLFWDIGKRAYSEFRDTNLLEEGFNQAKKLHNNWSSINDIDLICVSPCRRTIDTALFVFKDHKANMIAKDFLIEYPIGGGEKCNQRKNIEDLKYLYPMIDFTSIKNNILKWDNKDETHEQLNNRIQEMICWIGNRPEKNIAIVSHSSFIGMLKDKKIGDEKNELKHCHPYNIKFYYDENNNFLFLINEKNVNKLKSFKNM